MHPASTSAPKRSLATVLSSRYRRAKTSLASLVQTGHLRPVELYDIAVNARDAARDWRSVAPGIWPPILPEDLAGFPDLCRRAQEVVDSLAALISDVTLPDLSLDALESRLTELDSSRAIATRLPELQRLETKLSECGLTGLLDELSERDSNAAAAVHTFRYAWLTSLLDHLSIHEESIAAFEREALDRAATEFRSADESHIDAAAARVRRAWAERLVMARDEHPDQAGLVVAQAKRRRGYMPVRDLFAAAPDVLKAVKPCWVMSPLVVAQVLPQVQCFDYVVFDEASQIPPADAISSLLRGERTVVAGDLKQLPPTTFFAGGDDNESEDEDERDDVPEDDAEALTLVAGRQGALVRDIESILDVTTGILPPPHGTRTLQWHYRSKDQRLIAFSNAQEALYDWSLTTFLGVVSGDCIRHVLVPFHTGYTGSLNSVDDEVEQVVQLILEHAAERSVETLGVIALGSEHSRRIEETLRIRLRGNPYLDFFAEDKAEPFFVKNLERVQGDERDAIILSVGYGKTRDGRMRYVFGPVNQQGGERRLNVAITRARSRMTLVSSFSGGDIDPGHIHSVGPQMLYDYLRYAESGGNQLGMRQRTKPPLNPFEQDVLDRLSAAGLRVIPQYGSSGYWIDFAVMNPDRPGEPVLAIEADGASYHSAKTARDRDRLCQQHLEAIGWRFHRIWSTAWFRHRDQEIQLAVDAYHRAVSEKGSADNLPWATPKASTLSPLAPSPSKNTGPGREPWPGIRRNLSISEYSNRALRHVVRWVKSDGRLYTEDELLGEVMAALGFEKRGRRIVKAINAAIKGESATG